jgi:hypothetical protein
VEIWDGRTGAGQDVLGSAGAAYRDRSRPPASFFKPSILVCRINAT